MEDDLEEYDQEVVRAADASTKPLDALSIDALENLIDSSRLQLAADILNVQREYHRRICEKLKTLTGLPGLKMDDYEMEEPTTDEVEEFIEVRFFDKPFFCTQISRKDERPIGEDEPIVTPLRLLFPNAEIDVVDGETIELTFERTIDLNPPLQS